MPESRDEAMPPVRYFWLLPDGPVARFTRHNVMLSVFRDGRWVDAPALLGDVVLDPMPGEAREITEGDAISWMQRTSSDPGAQ